MPVPVATTLNAVDEPPAHSVNPIGCVVILVFGFTVTVNRIPVVVAVAELYDVPPSENLILKSTKDKLETDGNEIPVISRTEGFELGELYGNVL